MSAIEGTRSIVDSAFELITKLTKYAASQASVKEEISEDKDV